MLSSEVGSSVRERGFSEEEEKEKLASWDDDTIFAYRVALTMHPNYKTDASSWRSVLDEVEGTVEVC